MVHAQKVTIHENDPFICYIFMNVNLEICNCSFFKCCWELNFGGRMRISVLSSSHLVVTDLYFPCFLILSVWVHGSSD